MQDNTLDTASSLRNFDVDQLGILEAADGHHGLHDTTTIRQFVSFAIGDEEYCIDIGYVREIKGWTKVTPLPNTPEYVLGVLNLRGVIVPIFDMRQRFGLGRTETTPLHVVIIVAIGRRVMGILVDAVSDILNVSEAEIMAVPDLDTRGDRRFLKGLLTQGEKMVAQLALEKVFDLDALVSQLASTSRKSPAQIEGPKDGGLA